MKLRQLRVFGFKTFAEQVTLSFESGITAVVGPNGSGKSNLVDAIRWVLGEQSSKSLRSTKTDDVIFAGNDKRRPLGMCEVSLTFENDAGKLPVQYREVQITRRAYRAGEIEYYINRDHVRLRDVLDLLMGTGLGPGSYAIVSQGQIDSILTSKPAERRALFEETAGINKFLARKSESLRRLEQTEQNAIRINDLLSEIGTRIPELETAVRRAKRFRKTSARLRDLEILSYVRASASRRTERETVTAELEKRQAEREAALAKVATLEADLSTQRYLLYQQEISTEELRAASTQVRERLAEAEAEHAAAGARLESLQARSNDTSDDQQRVAAERSALEAALAELGAALGPLAQAASAASETELVQTREVAGMRRELEQVFAALRDLEARAAASAAGEAERRAHLAATQSELERLDADMVRLRDTATQAAELAAEATRAKALRQEELSLLGESLENARSALVEAERRHDDASRAVTAAQTHLREISSELARNEARLHTIEELETALEGHIPGTRAVIEAAGRGELPGIIGVISNLIRVDEKFARALDIAFGAGLSHIVTRTAEDAETAIAHLSARELGRATFLPLDTLERRTGRDLGGLAGRPGIFGYAYQLVTTAPEYEPIIAYLVGRVLVVDALPTGVGLVRNQGFRDSIVTLDGDQITSGGAMTGGRYKRERSILSRRAQAQHLREEIPRLRAELSRIEGTVIATSDSLEAAVRERENSRRAVDEVQLGIRECGNRIDAVDLEHRRHDQECARLLTRIHEAEQAGALARARLHELSLPVAQPVSQQERGELDARLADVRERIAAAEARQQESAAQAGRLRERLAGQTAERDAAAARLGMLDADTERAHAARSALETEIVTLRERVQSANGVLAELRAALDAAQAKINAARAEREATAARASELESNLRLGQIAEREALERSEAGRTRLAEIDAELGMLTTAFAQNPATDEECADVSARYSEEPDTVTDELPKLRDDLARLANVNLNAEAELEETAEREAFLKAQLDDLSRARETLLAVIAEIERDCQVKFNETFEAVREKFEEIYARLFPGGQAKMWQTDPEHLSETGIEISAQPPGKKMTNLAALSGGERAMTAAALIFALIKVKPSPFYLLDEVDAALDDMNVSRFSELVRETANEAQLLIVTHNKRTMELADRMYGVTMAEAGVSSVVSTALDREMDAVAG